MRPREGDTVRVTDTYGEAHVGEVRDCLSAQFTVMTPDKRIHWAFYKDHGNTWTVENE